MVRKFFKENLYFIYMVQDLDVRKKIEGLLPNIDVIRRKDFSLFDESGRVYLDSAATSQVPRSVLLKEFDYRTTNIRGSNHSKDSYESEEAGRTTEATRQNLVRFFNSSNYDTGFNSGTTSASNFVAATFPFESSDLAIFTEAEHHSQILSARNFAHAAGAKTLYVPIILPDGNLDLDRFGEIVKSHKNGKHQSMKSIFISFSRKKAT